MTESFFIGNFFTKKFWNSRKKFRLLLVFNSSPSCFFSCASYGKGLIAYGIFDVKKWGQIFILYFTPADSLLQF